MPFSITDLLVFLIIVTAVLPLARQWLRNMARVQLFRAIERKRSSRVIALIHRQETLSLLGFPVARYIDINDSEEVLRAIKLTDPTVPIDLILHTPGGLVLAAEQIALALCRHKANVTVFVPHYAMSGGTLVAMAADQIVMDENAVLGPVDPQLGQYPAASILTVLQLKNVNEIDDETLIMADMSRKALKQVKAAVKDILVLNNMPAERADAIAEHLSSGVWTHDYPISVSEGREIGLPISTEMPKEVYQLMELFPQSAQRRPSVEYIPMPYPAPARTPGRRQGSS